MDTASSLWRWPTPRAKRPIATYEEFFGSERIENPLYDLRRRGLRGVQLVTSDDHEGLKAAISRQFQGVSWQRCQVHFARTRRVRPYLLGRVAKRDRKRLADPANPSLDLKQIFRAPTLEWAREASGKVVEWWRGSHPALADQLERHVDPKNPLVECAGVFRVSCSASIEDSDDQWLGEVAPGDQAYPDPKSPILSPSLDSGSAVPSRARNGSLPEPGVVSPVGHSAVWR